MMVREIIKPQMTVLRFMHSKGLAEAFFQHTCFKASSLALYGDEPIHHPYSFMAMMAFWKKLKLGAR
jgi:hypothetical protein